jgi:hypothetical protein
MEISDTLMELAIVRGAILHSEVFDFVNHGKLFIVLGENDDKLVGFFFINSKISQYISKNPRFHAMQMEIKRSNYPDILDYNSFVGCHELMPIPKKDLVRQLKAGDVQIRGCLNESYINLMLEVVRDSDLFTEQQKATFFK